MNIAVITGASSGMGREFVYAIEREYSLDEIWIIARRKERLEKIASELSTPVRVLDMDLTQKDSLQRYRELLVEVKPEVNYPRLRLKLRGGGFVPLTRTQGRHLPAVPFDRDHFFSCGIPVTL